MKKKCSSQTIWGVRKDGCVRLKKDDCELATVTAAALAVIFVVGFVGNTCTCLVIIRARAMHTRANFFLLSLACSDMLLLLLGNKITTNIFGKPLHQTIIIACPLDFYTLMNCYTVTSDFLCKFWFFGKEAWGFLSVLIICSFTAERWLAIW
ncbi:unnamed protein product [Cylicostephanus goldi]|uniref:G-protein coupled receptors family 1 profile domain-containing protein n=1 Tax=Cylicostephanus goldi TaxID=71465 RepID=A0A3P7Q7A7_CYLGO|nr:unnamed protein product [Cylicostephanus goldi]